jgi:hypothetical protein
MSRVTRSAAPAGRVVADRAGTINTGAEITTVARGTDIERGIPDPVRRPGTEVAAVTASANGGESTRNTLRSGRTATE